MSRLRVSIGRLMVGAVLPGIPFALVRNAMWGESVITGNEAFDLGLWPGLVASLAGSYAILERRGRRSALAWGFTTTSWLALVAYLGYCLGNGRLVQRMALYYLNHFDRPGILWLLDSDREEVYALNLVVLGLFLAVPQLVAATLGGLAARWIWGKRSRWIST